MQELFSAKRRAETWRLLWLWLAEGQKELGLPINDIAIQQMRQNITMTVDDWKVVAERERKTRHDACYDSQAKTPLWKYQIEP